MKLLGVGRVYSGAEISDCNLIPALCTLAAGSASLTNAPANDGTTIVFSLCNNFASSGDAAQIAFHIKQGDHMKLYSRSKYNGSWRNWVEL